MNASPAELDEEPVGPEQLTKYQLELLYELGAEGKEYGLGIMESLEQYYDESLNHGRHYPNLTEMADLGLVDKTEADGRTNNYALTKRGKRLIRRDLQRRINAASRFVDPGELADDGGEE